MGGLIGYGHVVEIHQNASSAELKGDITFGTTYRIGGLVGYDAWMNQYYYNIFSGTFTNVNLINAGGIVGECQKSNCYFYFYYSYWDKEFSGLLNVCGVSKTDCDNSLGKTTNFLKTPSNLISILQMAWSFANNNSDNYSADFWDISHITGYPVPFWIEYDHVLDSPFAGGGMVLKKILS